VSALTSLRTQAQVALREVVRHVEASGARWCVFGGAALHALGAREAFEDVDLWVDGEGAAAFARAFPAARKAGANGLSLGPVETWWGPLTLAAGEATCAIVYDAELQARTTPATLFEVPVRLMSREDQIVMKAILQRGAEAGKRDVDDVARLLAAPGPLDLDYVRRHARLAGAEERVRALLARLGGAR
jgi:hypothetical protein